MSEPLVLLARLAKERAAAQRELDKLDAFIDTVAAGAQANNIGVRAIASALGVSKSKACVIAQRGRSRLDGSA